MADCTVPGCVRPSGTRGLCRGHYQQRLRGKAVADMVPFPNEDDRFPDDYIPEPPKRRKVLAPQSYWDIRRSLGLPIPHTAGMH